MLSDSNILRSIWLRVALFYTAMFAVSLFLILLLTLIIGLGFLEQQMRNRILTEVQFLHFEYKEDGLTEILGDIEERIERRGTVNQLLYVVQNADGDTIFDDFPTDATGWQKFERAGHEEGTDEYLFHYIAINGEYIVGVGSDLGPLADFRQAVRRTIAWSVLASLVIGSTTGILFGAYFSARLRRIIVALKSVARGNLQTRLPERSGTYEFELLSSELNRMFRQVELLLSNLKHVSTGLAHDLRTPLSVLKNRLQDIRSESKSGIQLEQAVSSAEAELESILTYFDSILLIAELESGDLVQCFETLEINSLLDSMLEIYRPMFDDCRIKVELHLEQQVFINGMTDLLQRLIANIFDNILMHSGGQCILEIRLKKRHHNAVLTITSGRATGTSPTPTPAPQARGMRRNHKGMGQKIVRAIAQLHGGDVAIDKGGSLYQYKITLPVSRG